ncbi:hypothetical protein SNEBB_006812 [Seison nebaliae]|nr:hypothetical protein SNEBB_006812 [Seison nebaliae]
MLNDVVKQYLFYTNYSLHSNYQQQMNNKNNDSGFGDRKDSDSNSSNGDTTEMCNNSIYSTCNKSFIPENSWYWPENIITEFNKENSTITENNKENLTTYSENNKNVLSFGIDSILKEEKPITKKIEWQNVRENKRKFTELPSDSNQSNEVQLNLNKKVEIRSSAFRARRPRTNFDREALKLLNEHFEKNAYPDINERLAIAHEINTNESRIQVWYQNRRSRLRKKLQKENNDAMGKRRKL